MSETWTLNISSHLPICGTSSAPYSLCCKLTIAKCSWLIVFQICISCFLRASTSADCSRNFVCSTSFEWFFKARSNLKSVACATCRFLRNLCQLSCLLRGARSSFWTVSWASSTRRLMRVNAVEQIIATMWYRFCRASASSRWQRVDAVSKLRISFRTLKKCFRIKIFPTFPFSKLSKSQPLGRYGKKFRSFISSKSEETAKIGCANSTSDKMWFLLRRVRWSETRAPSENCLQAWKAFIFLKFRKNFTFCSDLNFLYCSAQAASVRNSASSADEYRTPWFEKSQNSDDEITSGTVSYVRIL